MNACWEIRRVKQMQCATIPRVPIHVNVNMATRAIKRSAQVGLLQWNEIRLHHVNSLVSKLTGSCKQGTTVTTGNYLELKG